MPYRKGEGYDWLLVGFGVLIVAILAQESGTGTLVLGMASVGILFAGLRLGAWWLTRREQDE